MRIRFLILSLLAGAVLAITPAPARAQQPPELACPAGSSADLFFTTLDPVTSRLRNYGCIDKNGNLSLQGSAAGGAFTANGNVFYASPSCTAPNFGNCYNVRGTGAFDCGASWTNAQNTIVLSSFTSRQFTQADVGTIAWGALFQCGAVTEGAGQVVLGLAQTTITAVTDATHATVGGTFAGTCTAAGEGNCVFVWGDIDETTALTNAFVAATTPTGSVGCGTLNLTGIVFVSAPILNNVSTCLGPGNAGQSTRYSYAVIGNGENASMIVPIPSFNGTTCPSALPAIFGLSTGGGGAQGVYFRDFQINGFGSSISSVPGSGCTMMAIGADGFADHVSISNIANNLANVTGFKSTGIAGEPSYSIHVEVVSVGAADCVFGLNTQNIYPYCVGGTVPVQFTGGGPQQTVYTYQGNFGFVQAGAGVAFPASGSGTWYSDHDQFYFEHSGQFLVSCLTGWICYFDHDEIISANTSTNSTALSNPSGATSHVRSSLVSGTGTTPTAINNAGTLFDDGGNTFNSTGTVYSGAGAVFGSGSITGTAQVLGNISLLSGWGTGAAVVMVDTGDAHKFRFQITVGTTPGAGPTIGITLPTTYLKNPVCVITQSGGSQAIAQMTYAAASTSLVNVTYPGTPTATNTVIITVQCQ